MIGRRHCGWIVGAALLTCPSAAPEAKAQQPPSANNGVAALQPEAVQPRLSPRRRAPRARRYAMPRSLQSPPQMLPAPDATRPSVPEPKAISEDKSADGNRATDQPRIAPPSALPALMLAPPSRAPVTPAPYATKINLNRATLEQIQRLPGMTPGMAAHILAGRPFGTVSDLARIGVPFEIIEKIAPVVTIEP
jgi:competence protein ComEA